MTDYGLNELFTARPKKIDFTLKQKRDYYALEKI